MRLFVAVYPSATAADDFADLVGRLGVGRAAERGVNTRVAARPTWHVTLAFLGEVPERKLPAVLGAVEEAARTEPFGLRLAGGDTFGRRRFTILWVGLGGQVDQLRALSDRVRRQLKRARVPYDLKPFQPHLTLARPGDRLSADELAADLALLREYEGPEWTVDELRLVRSYQGPKPEYELVGSWPLANP